MTRPVAGFGLNDVDLRARRRPAGPGPGRPLRVRDASGPPWRRGVPPVRRRPRCRGCSRCARARSGSSTRRRAARSAGPSRPGCARRRAVRPGTVRASRAGVGAVHQVEAAVAGERRSGVAPGRRLGQGVECPESGPSTCWTRKRPVSASRARATGNRAGAGGWRGPGAVAGRVDEEDEAVVPRPRRGPFPLEPEIGGPAVVAVRDESLVPGEVCLDLAALGRVRHGPEPVPEAVLRRGGEQRLPQNRALDHRARPRRRPLVAAVGQQQRFQVGPCRTHQLRAVRDDVVHDVLVGSTMPSAVGAGARAPIRPRWRISSLRCS